MVKYRKYIIWSLMAIVLVLFWFSLRSSTQQMEFSIAALIAWVITFSLDKYLKNAEKKENQED